MFTRRVFSRSLLTTALMLAAAPLVGAPTVFGQVSAEDVLAGGAWFATAVPVPGSAQQSPSACWSSDLSEGWPVVTSFAAGDLLAYATGPIRVTRDNPGPHTVGMHIEHFAEVRGEYRHLQRADLHAQFEIYNEADADFTDWFLAVYMTVPRIVRFLPEPRSVDWSGAVSGYVNYGCSGQIRLVPPPPPPPPSRER